MIAPLLWGLLLGCTPDETGYGDTDLGLPEDDAFDDMGSEAPTAGAEGVSYTAERTLGAEPVPVTFLALPGTFAGPASIVVAVAGRGPGTPVDLVEGGFVVTVDAALDDVVSVLDGTEVLTSILLADDLGPLASTDEADGDVPPDAPRGVAVDGDGVAVGDGALDGFLAPYVAYNAGAGAARRVARGDTDVVLPAEAGDEVCVAPEVDGRLRVATCFGVD